MANPNPVFATLEEKLRQLLATAIAAGVFPGAAAAVALGPPDRGSELLLGAGHTTYAASPAITAATLFDLASLTKPLATTLALLALRQEGRLDWESTLPELLQRPVPGDKAQITLRQLLSHSSGLPAHRPYFQALAKIAAAERRETLLAWILGEELLAPPGQAPLYSDLGFLLLGWSVERLAGTSLDRYVAERIYRPWGLEEHLFFRPLPAAHEPHRLFAPSEECPWRQRLLAGEVHDDNCHVLGGVAGHAGLFGDLAGLLRLTTRLLEVYQGRASHPCLAAADLQRAWQREGTAAGSDWGLGFDTPAASGSSGGRYLSAASVGHLGFTGTSFWIDPARELVMLLLSNRVHPQRDNARIRQFRPRFHDLIITTLGLTTPLG